MICEHVWESSLAEETERCIGCGAERTKTIPGGATTPVGRPRPTTDGREVTGL